MNNFYESQPAKYSLEIASGVSATNFIARGGVEDCNRAVACNCKLQKVG